MQVIPISHPIAEHWNWLGGARRAGTGPGNLEETCVEWPKHGFTHVDAPSHILHGGRSLDNCSLDRLCGEAAMVDVSDLVPSRAVSANELEARGRHVAAGDILILRSNLHRRFPTSTDAYWQNSPWLDESGSQWVVDRGCKALAVDFPQDFCAREMNCRTVLNEEFVEHHIVLGAGLMHLEHVTNLWRTDQGRVFLIALPLRLPGADGGPSGAVMMCGWPSRRPRIADLSLPVRADWRERAATRLAKSFENGDPVQETGVRFDGHSHTHVLTPRYLDPEGVGLEQFHGAPLVGPADIAALAPVDDCRRIATEDLQECLPGERSSHILILRSGFMDRVPYDDPDWTRRSPWLAEEAAAWIVDRGYSVLGADFEIDPGRKRQPGAGARAGDLCAEALLLRSGAAILKNLANLAALGAGGAWVAATPLNLPGAEAAPARVLGLEW